MRSIALPLIAILAAACGPPALPMPPSPAIDPRTPPPPPPPLQVRRPPPTDVNWTAPPPEICRCIRICVVRHGRLLEIPAVYNSTTGDTLTEDRLPFSSAAPLTGEYASVAGWYVGRDTLTIRGRRFAPYGLPRALGIQEVAWLDEYRGVGVYGEAGQTDPGEYVYLPLRPGCEFQTYQRLPATARRR